MKTTILKQSTTILGAMFLITGASATNTVQNDAPASWRPILIRDAESTGELHAVPPRPTQRIQLANLQADYRHPLVKPQYPKRSVEQNEEGSVELLIYVLPSGDVGEAKIKTSSGYRRLDEAALINAKRTWRFEPSNNKVESTGEWGIYRITFKLIG